jgi:hypothetical protein
VLATTFTPPPPTPEREPMPLVMLIEYDPWRMVLDSDSPTFVLYDDGTVIYVRETLSGDLEYASVTLDEEELVALREELSIDEDFFALDENYDSLLPTDQPTNFITVWDEELGMKRISVYGNLRDSKEARDLAPQAYLSLFDKVVNYTHEDAETWLPEQFEAVMWLSESSEAAAWPKDWPDLDHPTTVKREMVYSIYLDIDLLDDFLELGEDSSGYFRINGEVYYASLRYPFPNEAVWMEG